MGQSGLGRELRRDFVAQSGYHRPMSYAVLLFALPLLVAQDGPNEAQVEVLIEKLGTEKIEVREEATLGLTAMGQIAMPQLEKAAKSINPEVALRAQSVLSQLRKAMTPSRRSEESASSRKTTDEGNKSVLIELKFISTTNEDLLSFDLDYELEEQPCPPED